MSVSPLYYACFLNNYNNYFNRIIKGYATLSEYQTELGTSNYFLFSKPINYNPKDNVSTELIINDCPFEPDYVLILDSSFDIVARWFVMHSSFTREKQRKLELRRDLIFDFKEELKESPMFVHKGYLKDNDSFIVNDEGMSFNQIKSQEILLKDKTNSAWIVGYIAKNAAATDVGIQVNDVDIDFITASDLASASGISEEDLSSVFNLDGLNTYPSFFTKKIQMQYWEDCGGLLAKEYLNMNPNFDSYLGNDWEFAPLWAPFLWHIETTAYLPYYNSSASILANKMIYYRTGFLADLITIFNRPYFKESQLNILLGYADKIIRYNGKFYKLKFNVVNSNRTDASSALTYTSYTSLQNAVSETATAMGTTPRNAGEIWFKSFSQEVYIQLEYISDESGIIPAVQTKVSSGRNVVENQAFDMFCIPAGPALFKSDLGTKAAAPDYALSIGAAIAVKLDSQLYDLQLLPYCPLIDKFDNNNKIDLTALSVDSDFNYIDKTDTRVRTTVHSDNATVSEDPDLPGTYLFTGSITIANKVVADILDDGFTIEGSGASDISNGALTLIQSGSDVLVSFTSNCADREADVSLYIWYEINGTDHVSFILWARQATFSTKINRGLSLKDSMKVESQCNFYRLTSPNYQGSFEFNVAKNGGSVAYFLAECTYKPYTPYIKVVPQFSFLYGANYGDQRGLVCGGDFSLPRFTSAWENYLLNNKNYQNIFNREIQNLSFEQRIQRISQVASGISGLATAGAIGGGVGAQAGGVYGAIAGAVLGTAASGVGFGLDMDLLAQRQKEEKGLAIDKYNYQLGNIKALPYTITKIGAFDINSKIWPFLEYYTCTDEEKAALESKITYESMTVMRIDQIGKYFEAFTDKHYLKGELIRNEAIADDNHVLEAIYYEFMKGVYC